MTVLLQHPIEDRSPCTNAPWPHLSGYKQAFQANMAYARVIHRRKSPATKTLRPRAQMPYRRKSSGYSVSV